MYQDELFEEFVEDPKFPETYKEAAELLFGDKAQTFPDLNCMENVSYSRVSLPIDLDDIAYELGKTWYCDAITKVKFIKKIFNNMEAHFQEEVLPDLLTFFLFKYMKESKQREEHSINEMLGKYIELKGMARPHNKKRVNELENIIRKAVDELSTFAQADKILEQLTEEMQGEIQKCANGK